MSVTKNAAATAALSKRADGRPAKDGYGRGQGLPLRREERG